MISIRSAVPFALAVLLGSHLAGCGIFDTREPESPTNAGSEFEPPITPTVVLRNMESAIAYANASDYQRCFSDSSRGLPPFVFQPSVQGIAAAPTAFADWHADDELAYIQNIFAELQTGSSSLLTLTPNEVTDAPIGDSVQYTAEYSVQFPHTREGAEHEASGTLQFTLTRSPQNEWYITRWKDISDGTNTSWSLIKARFIDR